MWKLLKKKKKEMIVSPIQGKLINLSMVKDEAFASKAMGDGFAVEPSENKIVAPISGTICAVFPTKHAFGIANDHAELIVHIGIDTVNLKGVGFHSFVEQGEKVKQGQVIAEIDLDAITQQGYDITTMVVFTDNNVPKLLKLNEFVCGGEEVAELE